MILRALGRMIVVPLAFVLASLSAMLVLLTLGQEHLTRALYGRDGFDAFEVLLVVFRQGIVLASAASILPALLVAIVGEVARIRSLLFYVLGGGAAMAAIPLLARLGQSAPAAAPNPIVWQVFATAGFVGGLVYWALAGRRA